MQNVLPQALVDFVNKSESPEALAAGQQAVAAANAVGGVYKAKYGSLARIKDTLYNDPVGAVADLSTLLTGGGAAAKGLDALARERDRLRDALARAERDRAGAQARLDAVSGGGGARAAAKRGGGGFSVAVLVLVALLAFAAGHFLARGLPAFKK